MPHRTPSFLLTFPLMYYVTRPMVRYRFPIEPFLAIVAVYGVFRSVAWILDRQPGLRSPMPWVREWSAESDGELSVVDI
jgi:hypothetical protein